MVVVPGLSIGAGVALDAHGVEGPEVLAIDRHPLFLAALGGLLASPPLCARIQVAHDTEAGLQIALRGSFHLVFCDIRAEPVSAIDLARRLDQLTPRVPVIVLGDPEDERLMTAALHTSVAGLFTKDAKLDEFLVGVRAVLSGHRAVGANVMGNVLARLADRSSQRRGPAGQLSPTERDILTMIGQAKSIPAIAATRGISHKTVRNHLANIYRKLDLNSRTEAMLCAARMGLTAN